MRKHTLASICGGFILAMVSIGAHSDVGASLDMVNRTHKGDRLPMAQVDVPRAQASDLTLPDGCDALVSSLTQSRLARIAGRCVS
jgi:hypothetical protein